MKTHLSALLLSLLPALPTLACGGGGGGDQGAPSQVAFPTSGAITDAAAITVSGRSAVGGVARVLVEQVPATSTDGFATWSATVPLGVGTNRLDVEVEDADGAPVHAPLEVVVVRRAFLVRALNSIAVDPIRDLGWMLESSKSLMAFDPTSGELQYVSGDQRGGGPLFPQTLRVAPEPGGSFVYVATTGGLFAVDVASGDRAQLVLSGDFLGQFVRDLVYEPTTKRLLVVSNLGLYSVDPVAMTSKRLLAEGDTSKGPTIGSMQALAVDLESRDVYVVSPTEIQRVDPVTGEHELVTKSGVGFARLLGIAVDSKRGTLYAMDNLLRLLYEVDPFTGDLKALVQLEDGASPTRIAYDDVNDRVLICEIDTDRVLGYDIESGQLLDVVSHRVGAGPSFDQLGEVVVDGGRWFAAEIGEYELLEVDPGTGDRALVSGETRGLGEPLDSVEGIALDLAGGRAFVSSSSDEAIFEVDLATGDRTVLFQAEPGSPFDYPIDVERLSDGTLLVLDGFADGLYRLDPSDSTVSPFSVDGDGNGAAFVGNPWGMFLDEADRRVLVSMRSSAVGGRILSIDLDSGVRTIFADDATVGSGESLDDPTGMALDTDANVLYVASRNESRILAIDLATGARTVHSGDGIGSGPPVSFPRGLALDRDGGQLLAYSAVFDMLIGVSLETGERVILSE